MSLTFRRDSHSFILVRKFFEIYLYNEWLLLVLSNSSSEVNLTFNLLKDIWETVVNNAFIKAERDVLYKWLKESTDSKSTFPMNIDDLIQFFKEKMTDKRESKYMTAEGFNCFRNFFLLINEKLEKIKKISSASSTGGSVINYPSGYSHVSGTYYSSYSYLSSDENKASNQVKPFQPQIASLF